MRCATFASGCPWRPSRPQPLDDTAGAPRICELNFDMKLIDKYVSENGKIGYALLWLLGVPLPILLIIYLIRG
jgi:hypothetical protein